MNEQTNPASPDPAPSGDDGSQPEPAAPRPRRRPGLGQVGAAATSRTAGWMVAAALGGSLVTLLLAPGRLPAAAPAGVAFHRPVFNQPGGARPPGAARRFAMPAQPPGQVYALPPGQVPALPPGQVPALPPGQVYVGPDGRKVLAPGTVMPGAMPGGVPGAMPGGMPGCQFAVPGELRPGWPARFRLVHPPMIQRIAVRPSKRGPRVQIVRPRIQYVGPPMMKRITIWRAGRPGARRVFQWTITRPGAVVVGPGSIVALPSAGPGCVIYSRVGPPSATPFPG